MSLCVCMYISACVVCVYCVDVFVYLCVHQSVCECVYLCCVACVSVCVGMFIYIYVCVGVLERQRER